MADHSCVRHLVQIQALDSRCLFSVLIEPHVSVPITVVFARNAPPLSLPALDKYLGHFPLPPLSSLRAHHKPREATSKMFPPMERLATAKRSLRDLEHNNAVQPGWKNRSSIFGSLVNLALAITVSGTVAPVIIMSFNTDTMQQGSSAVAKFYSLHGFIDIVQIFALLMNSISMSSLPRTT